LSLKNSNTFRDLPFGKLRLLSWAIAGFLLVYFATAVRALDPHRTISQYSRQYWGIDKNYPGGSVTSFAQTRDGYLWIGTDRGLIRFDGLNFRVFDRAIPTSSPIGPVRQLGTDVEGNLWVVLQSTSLLRYHQGKFEPGRDQAGFGITAVANRADGTALLSSLVYGELTYSKGQFAALSSPSDQDNGAQTEEGGETADEMSSRFSSATGVAIHRFAAPNAPVIAMAEARDGKIWLGTEQRGLFYLLNGKVFPAAKDWRSGKINCLLPLEDGTAWIGTEKGVLEWNGANVIETGIPPALRNGAILSCARDRDSNVWMGTSTGLVRIHDDEVTSDTESRTALGPVTALFEDREGNLWLGHPNGIERLRDSTFVTYPVAAGQSESSGPVYVDQEGRTWYAPIEGGLRWLKGDQTGVVTNDSLNHDVVYSIAGDKDNLWVGRQQGGLTNLRLAGGSITNKTYTQADGLAQNGVYAVFVGRDGSVWAATLTGGVSKYSHNQFTTYTTRSGLASNTVVAMAESSNGTMWFGTPEGLSALSNGDWSVFTNHNGLPSNSVNCLLSDSAGVLWIGTESGLAFVQNGHLEVPSGEPASLHEPILGIAEDKKDRLWIATSNHVLVVNRDYLTGQESENPGLRDYGVEDGLRGTEGVKRFQSVSVDDFGRIWISTNRGLAVADTARAGAESAPSIVRIEGLTVDGNLLDVHEPIRIPPGSHRVTLSFSGLSLSVPERVRFRYKLDGFDKNWSEPVTSREAVYTNLGARSYRFHVIASNSYGIWGQPGAALDFSVAPQWFETGMFRILFVVSIISLAIAIYRLRVRQIAKAISTRFDERLAERTRLARDLHDTFLQTVQGSKLVADNALDEASEPARLRRSMEQISVWLGQAAQEGRAALNSLRTSTLERNDLAAALERATQNGIASSTMAVTFSVIGEAREMHPIVRDEIYRIGFEAIRNAHMHSKASALLVELKYGHDLTVRIKDDGLGIDSSVLDKGKEGHYGLRGMRERAARIGGKFTIVSSTKSGTEITISVPGKIIFRKSNGMLGERLKSLFSGKSRNSRLN
jgi:ligand-binding sensor domain-containing protein/signal transduction histidine kinase